MPAVPVHHQLRARSMLTNILLRLTFVGAEWVLWILVLLSVISVALIVERCLYFYNHRVDGEQLGQQLEQLLQEGNVRGAWDLVNGSDCIEHEVVAAGLPALRRGATACSEAMLAAKARMKPLLDARLSRAGDDRQQRAVRGPVGHGARHRQGGPRPDRRRHGAGRSQRGDGRRVRGPGRDGRRPVRRHSRGGGVQPVATARANTMAQVDSLAHLVLANVRVESKSA